MIRLAVLLIVTATLIGTAIWAGLNLDSFEPKHVAETLRTYGAFAPAAFAVARVVAAVVLLPGAVLAIAAGMLFGPVWGAVYNVLAATVGAVLAFAIARFLAPNWAARAVEGRVGLAAMMQSIEAEGWRFVAFVRLMPVLPYNLLNYALGVTSIRLSQFTLATLVFMIPIDVAYSYLGYAGYQALSGEAGAMHSALIGVAVFATLLFLPAFVRRYRRRRGALVETSDGLPPA
jgi:uncharacterized membrane protein YdjX (TVP38/TMEM64 family)